MSDNCRNKQEVISKLQKEAKEFLMSKIIIEGIVIFPKEVESYYSKMGIFEDDSVHGNKLQRNKRDHFYKHRWGKEEQDAYKGGNRAGIDFVISDNEDEYYSILIRSAIVNGDQIVGPHKVLEKIKSDSNLSYKEIENKMIKVEPNFTSNNIVLFSRRINLGNKVSEEYQNYYLRAVLCDEYFRGNKYPRKEEMIIQYIISTKMTNTQAIEFANKFLGYIPSKIRNS